MSTLKILIVFIFLLLAPIAQADDTSKAPPELAPTAQAGDKAEAPPEKDS